MGIPHELFLKQKIEFRLSSAIIINIFLTFVNSSVHITLPYCNDDVIIDNDYQLQRGVYNKMTLKQGTNNTDYQVVSIDLELQLERRLEALGLTEGTCITILNNDKKGSLTARFRGTRFALGRRIAEHIEVKELENR